MFKPVSLFVGFRYTRTRKRNFFISFVSIISMLGITLGVLSMIVVLSVINGSTTFWRTETLKSVPHVIISASASDFDWRELTQQALLHPQVLAAAPYLEGEAWVRYQGRDQFIRLRGVDPGAELEVMDSPSSQLQDLLQQLDNSENGQILGGRLARDLGIFNNQSVGVTPLRSLLGRSLEDIRSFNILGVGDFGIYGNDSVALVQLDEALELFPEQQVQIRLRVNDVFNAATIAQEAVVEARATTDELRIIPWSESQRTLFDALRMEKILTGFMLLMVVIIGAVNIISTLVMVVADKGADIAILRTMGARKLTVMAVFVVQGTLAGLFGVVLGTLSGVLIATNLSTLTRLLESFMSLVSPNDQVMVISFLRAEVIWSDIFIISGVALLISFLATLYPAYRATRVQPAAVLRYE